MTANKLQLQEPCILLIEAVTADGLKSVELDVFEAWRFLEESTKQPGEQQRWNQVRKWLAEKLQVSPSELKENMLRLVHDAIITLGQEEQKAIVGKLSSIVSLPQPIPVSQATTPDGQLS